MGTKKQKPLNRVLAAFIAIIMTLSITACGGRSSGGGLVQAFVHEGIYENCISGGSGSSAGKVTEIDGVEIKLPVDWNYAHSQQSDFVGNNWEGDDSVRGIGIFNCNEEGDESQEYAQSYSINMRWEYYSYGYREGAYPYHANYKGKDSTGQIEVGGTDASCVTASGGSIISGGTPVDNEEYAIMKKVKIVVYNPETGKACVCAPGFYSRPDLIGDPGHPNWENGPNWGGAPLALLGGIPTAVSEAVGAEQNETVLEMYFADPDAELGPCEYNPGSGAVAYGKGAKNKCSSLSNVDLTDTAKLAVRASYDPLTPDWPDHEVISYPAGSDGSSTLLPTTQVAIDIRKLATDGADDRTADCGYFVCSIVIMTLDKDFPLCWTTNIKNYCTEHSDNYELIMEGTYVEIEDSGLAQPGDILVTEGEGSSWGGHTVIYVGNEAIKEQYPYIDEGYNLVGASQDKHGPSIQGLKATNSYDTRKYQVFRYIGEKNPHENASKIQDYLK